MRRRALRLAANAIGLLIVAAPAITMETACRAPLPAPRSAFGVTTPADQHQSSAALLAYPAWSIVHSQQDFAASLRGGDADRFAYASAIRDYWVGLCGVNRASPGTTLSTRIGLYALGAAFTAQTALAGVYENTLGRAFAALRGPRPTAEDLFQRQFAAESAAYLAEHPWHDIGFWPALHHLWWEIPLDHPPRARAIERRAVLGAAWGIDALVATALAGVTGNEITEDRVELVVSGHDRARLTAFGDLTVTADLGGGNLRLSAPRAAFSTRLLAVLAAGWQLREIDGSTTVFATILLPEVYSGALPDGSVIFTTTPPARPLWHRIGLRVPAAALAALVAQITKNGGEIEQIYDF